jgi:Uma2 family endonuclease
MSTQPVHYLTVEEYLELEESAERPSDYYRGEVFPMEDVTMAHADIVTNLLLGIGPEAETRGCRVVSTGVCLTIQATGLRTYPDATVFCGAHQFGDPKNYSVVNPKIIFEVESPSTKDRDSAKFNHYKTLPSLDQYLIVAQHEPSIHVYLRDTAEKWSIETIRGLDQTLYLRALDFGVPFARIYRGVLSL